MVRGRSHARGLAVFRRGHAALRLLEELENTYNIELSDYVQAYKSEFGMENEPYVINVIDHYKEIRDLYTMTLDGIMQKLNLKTENNTVTKNIFDTLAMKLCQEENKGE